MVCGHVWSPDGSLPRSRPIWRWLATDRFATGSLFVGSQSAHGRSGAGWGLASVGSRLGHTAVFASVPYRTRYPPTLKPAAVQQFGLLLCERLRLVDSCFAMDSRCRSGSGWHQVPAPLQVCSRLGSPCRFARVCAPLCFWVDGVSFLVNSGFVLSDVARTISVWFADASRSVQVSISPFPPCLWFNWFADGSWQVAPPPTASAIQQVPPSLQHALKNGSRAHAPTKAASKSTKSRIHRETTLPASPIANPQPQTRRDLSKEKAKRERIKPHNAIGKRTGGQPRIIQSNQSSREP